MTIKGDDGMSAFFYGTLMSPAILSRVTARNDLTARPALLPNHRRHRVRQADYPAIIPAGASDSVRGTYVEGLTRNDLNRLDLFEGDEYQRVPVRVQLLGYTGKAEDMLSPSANGGNAKCNQLREHEAEVDCQTYVWLASHDELEDGEWDFEEFIREKMWRWAPGGEGERREYAAIDAAAPANTDPTHGRAIGGSFERAAKG